MRLSFRLNLSLIAGVALTSLVFTLYQTVAETRRMRGEAERNARFLADSLERSAEAMLEKDATAELLKLVDRYATESGKTAVAIFDANGEALAVTSTYSAPLPAVLPPVRNALAEGIANDDFMSLGGDSILLLAVPLRNESRLLGALAVIQNVAYIDEQTGDIWKRSLLHMAVQTFFIVCITLLIIRMNLKKPLGHLTQWMRDLRTGRPSEAPDLSGEKAFEPIATEVSRIANSLTQARRAAEEEARLRDAAESTWTLERLRVHVQGKLGASRLFVISNREPYEHFFTPQGVSWKVPASGLVTALDPVLDACGGTWIAQGSGDADRQTVDEFDRVSVPPDHPKYSLRRVWLTPEQEEGFYLGFSNEGVWPLCHIAHTRPIFRSEDWQHYREVNQQFADALIEEVGREKNPVVLVQDYHFALLPRMIKERLPQARVAIFWHIPWPNPEAFSICPWQHELLDGLLGADLIGFHVQAHCNNFLDTVDRAIECRIERERFGVNRLGHFTAVRPFPISVSASAPAEQDEFSYDTRAALLRKLGVEAPSFGIGVDRIDYTKGIPERFAGVERFFELNPSYRKQFTFVQIGAPSRSHIRRYQELESEVEREAERINRRFQTGSWRPIVLIKRAHSHKEILPYYRAASMCLVTSLHDGMNLVAKEFVASREDEGGVLVLSRFAGATHELRDALTVNPYDTGQIARAIRESLEMPPEERIGRMRRMRSTVREHNVYRWAGNLLSELCEIRIPAAPRSAQVKNPRAVLAAKP